MVVKKRKKTSRQRGSSSHGWGHKKKHRGAGSRGGKGMAGSGKRADQKKPTILTKIGYKKYFGRHGFTPINRKQVISINLEKLDKLKSEKQGELIVIDLNKLGYDKLLGTGKVTLKYKLTVKQFSKSAENKIKKAGGQIIKC